MEGFEYKNPEQILNMGGPWIGNLFYKGFEISKNVLLDNRVLSLDTDRAFFVKYHPAKQVKDVFFTLCFYVFNTSRIYQYKTTFDKLYIGKMPSDNTLTLFHAFHSEISEAMFTFQLDCKGFAHVTTRPRGGLI